MAATTLSRAVVLMNPRSGGGKVRRFGLIERAEQIGAQVRVTGPGRDAASLARAAVEQGAEVLGVAGGDGTVSAVAAVAVETGRPLVGVPVGTRNHFARDLGLDLRNPARALAALHDAEPVRVDVGVVGARVFINNVSFGVYAEALLDPGYRAAKARTLASIAPRYLEGQHRVEASVDTPADTVEFPQVVLVSNNPYHLSSLRCLGWRFTLGAGVLGAVVIKRPAAPGGRASGPAQSPAATRQCDRGRGHQLVRAPGRAARPGRPATGRDRRRARGSRTSRQLRDPAWSVAAPAAHGTAGGARKPGPAWRPSATRHPSTAVMLPSARVITPAQISLLRLDRAAQALPLFVRTVMNVKIVGVEGWRSGSAPAGPSPGSRPSPAGPVVAGSSAGADRHRRTP